MHLRPATALAVVALFALALVPAFAADKPQDLIVGKWKPNDAKDEANLEFTKDGKVKVTGKEFTLDGTYKFVDDKSIEVKFSLNGMDRTVKLKVTVSADEMTTSEDGKEKKDTFKRVK